MDRSRTVGVCVACGETRLLISKGRCNRCRTRAARAQVAVARVTVKRPRVRRPCSRCDTWTVSRRDPPVCAKCLRGADREADDFADAPHLARLAALAARGESLAGPRRLSQPLEACRET